MTIQKSASDLYPAIKDKGKAYYYFTELFSVKNNLVNNTFEA